MKISIVIIFVFFASFNAFAQVDLLNENFESSFPPNQWSISSTGKNWQQNELVKFPFSSVDKKNQFSAVCPWEFNKRLALLVSPYIDSSPYKSLYLSFYVGFNKTMLKNDTIDLLIKKDKNKTWDNFTDVKSIWMGDITETDTSKTPWSWRRVEIDMLDYAGSSFNLAWRSKGQYGDIVAIDSVHLIGSGLSKRADILDIKISNQSKKAAFNASNDTITVVIANQPDLKLIQPTIQTSLGATITPASDETLNYTIAPITTYNYTVKAADERIIKKWVLNVVVDNIGHDANITSFALPVQISDSINSDYKTITIKVKGGTNLKDIHPIINLSLGASSSPKLENLFSFEPNKIYPITIYPQDPNYPSKIWNVKVEVKYDNRILGFSLPGSNEIALIDSVKHLITLEVDKDFSLVQITPKITLSGGSNILPASNEKITFIPDVPFTFQVFGEKDQAVSWTVVILKKEAALFEEEFDENKIPTDWKFTNSKDQSVSWIVKDQARLPYSSVYYKSKSSALHPWSFELKNDSLISPIYDASNSNNIQLKFHAGFNKSWTANANLLFYIAKAPDYKPILKWDAKSDTSTYLAWKWHHITMKINELSQSKFKLIWQYIGEAGDLVGIDRLLILSDNSKKIETENQLNLESVVIYPIPAKDFLNIEKANRAQFRLYNCVGTKIKDQTLTSDLETINLENCPNGLYFIELEKNTKLNIIKIIISK